MGRHLDTSLLSAVSICPYKCSVLKKLYSVFNGSSVSYPLPLVHPLMSIVLCGVIWLIEHRSFQLWHGHLLVLGECYLTQSFAKLTHPRIIFSQSFYKMYSTHYTFLHHHAIHLNLNFKVYH